MNYFVVPGLKWTIMELVYLPTSAIIIDNMILKFGDSREEVRNGIGALFTEDNSIYSVGDVAIEQRRDVYLDINAGNNYFFLGYDRHDRLVSLEVHNCVSICIGEIQLSFEYSFEQVVNSLSVLENPVRIGDKECLFRESHFVVASDMLMGGDADTFGYFYCSLDISHLLT